MLNGLHSFWQQLVLWYNASPVLALLCLLMGLTAVLLWIWVKKWSWLWQNATAAQSMAVTASLPREGIHQLKGPQWEEVPHVMDKCLVLEWEVSATAHSIGDIGNLEQKLVKLQSLRLDSAYHVVVSLFPDQGVLNPRIAEILERRFPGFVFQGLGERPDKSDLIQSGKVI